MLVQLRSRLTPYNGRDPRERGSNTWFRAFACVFQRRRAVGHAGTTCMPHTVLNALGLECVSVLFARAGKRDRACVGEGNSEACEAAVVWMWTVMRWPRPLAVSPLLAGASWWEPDLVVKREMLLCTGGHTHQSTQGDNTGIARRWWS